MKSIVTLTAGRSPRTTQEMFGARKPIIAMAHLLPTPGTPLYDREGGPDAIVDAVKRDVAALCAAGVDAIMFCNEGDRPYQLHAEFQGVAMLARVVAEVAPRDRPFGVDFLWDAKAAMAVAVATGAQFIREVLSGVYESDMGLWQPDAGELLRYRRSLEAPEVAVLVNITPEFASRLGSRSVAQVAESVVVSSLADAILISGARQGVTPALETVREAKAAVGEAIPVFVNTGAKNSNVRELLSVADGVIVGSDLKVDGDTWNPVDPERAAAFVKQARAD